MAAKTISEMALPLLSVTIGMIMEDEVTEAVITLPSDQAQRAARFEALARAGTDIATLAAAAAVLLRRYP
jgi:hypothetical protein